MTGSRDEAFGLTEWFRPGEYERVERALDAIDAVGARWLRTHLSWADHHAEGGREWYDWLLPRLAERVEVLPCIHYTPPSLSRTGATSGPPKRLRDFADFVDTALTRHGASFPRVELWNEPNNLLDWDWRTDPGWPLFAEMLGAAAHWAQERGWPVVLGGPNPFDAGWIETMGEHGVLDKVAAVSIHGFPGTWDSETGMWGGWQENIAATRAVLDHYRPEAEIWITEAGYSTWRHDEAEQAQRFLDALDAPADRLYWYALEDLPSDIAVQEGHRFDIRHYHMGIRDAFGRDKLLARLLRQGGVPAVRRKLELASRRPVRAKRPVLITGGAGFIGCNLADTLLKRGREVIVFDNFARPGVSTNADWLRERHGARVTVHAADVRDRDALADAVEDAAAIYHLAAQVAMTSSCERPAEDFAINAAATVDLLETLRAKERPTPLIFASTNKVYGVLQDIALEATDLGYMPVDSHLQASGISEAQPLELHTPYGCSKGAADQYVLDYARTFGLPAAVMRMSCIYGPRQFGTEDQGWVAHFILQALKGKAVTIYGDGHQVRDILHVNDAVAAYLAVMERIETLSGQAFNLGGGPDNAISLRMLLAEIERLTGSAVERRMQPPRTGDQLYFTADTARLSAATGWQAKTSWHEGVKGLLAWLEEERIARPVQVQSRPQERSVHA